jgi:outer membrane protein assembly factor BamB
VICIYQGVKQWFFATDDPVTADLITDGEEGGCCDYVYFVAGQDEASSATLYAVSVLTGTKVWEYTLTATASDTVTAPPSFGSYDDIVVPFGENIYSIDKETGFLNW